MVFRDRANYLAEGRPVRGADVQAPRVSGATATGRMHARNASSVTVAELRHSQSALDQRRPAVPAGGRRGLAQDPSFLEALALSSFSQQRFPPSVFYLVFLLIVVSLSISLFFSTHTLCRCRLSF
jgi:hypothetical protein